LGSFLANQRHNPFFILISQFIPQKQQFIRKNENSLGHRPVFIIELLTYIKAWAKLVRKYGRFHIQKKKV